jgi:hypothetical protein
MGLWARKPSPLLALKPILIFGAKSAISRELLGFVSWHTLISFPQKNLTTDAHG